MRHTRIIGREKNHFDEREIVAEYLRMGCGVTNDR